MLFFKYCLCDQINYSEMADCVMCMSKVEIHTNVYSKHVKFQDHLKHVDVNQRIIVKRRIWVTSVYKIIFVQNGATLRAEVINTLRTGDADLRF